MAFENRSAADVEVHEHRKRRKARPEHSLARLGYPVAKRILQTHLPEHPE
jgi:hypothetical protein